MMNMIATLIPSGPELWIILLVILVLFGGKKIPELMRGVGKGVGELHKGLEEGRRAMEKTAEEEAAKPSADEAAEPTAEKGKVADGKS
jgi:sec-independent protein translocase protein TatA